MQVRQTSPAQVWKAHCTGCRDQAELLLQKNLDNSMPAALSRRPVGALARIPGLTLPSRGHHAVRLLRDKRVEGVVEQMLQAEGRFFPFALRLVAPCQMCVLFEETSTHGKAQIDEITLAVRPFAIPCIIEYTIGHSSWMHVCVCEWMQPYFDSRFGSEQTVITPQTEIHKYVYMRMCIQINGETCSSEIMNPCVCVGQLDCTTD